MGTTIGDVLALAAIVAIVYVIVRPWSPAADILDAITRAIRAIIRTAVG